MRNIVEIVIKDDLASVAIIASLTLCRHRINRVVSLCDFDWLHIIIKGSCGYDQGVTQYVQIDTNISICNPT